MDEMDRLLDKMYTLKGEKESLEMENKILKVVCRMMHKNNNINDPTRKKIIDNVLKSHGVIQDENLLVVTDADIENLLNDNL